MPRRLAALAAGLTVALVTTAPALAEEQCDSRGGVTATLSFEERRDYGYRDLRLTIDRAGVTAYDAPVTARDCEEPFCFPGGGSEHDSVRVRDLDQDGEPEVLLDLFTGGAHCCFASQVLAFDGTAAYEMAAERNWGDVGYRLKDVDGDGRRDFRSADPRFAYAFTAYAFAAFPIQVFAWEGRLVDRTDRMRAAIRADARHWRREYERRPLRYQPQGPLAAWAADQYRLGRRAQALRLLRREVRSGRLRSMPGGKRFPRKLDRKLHRWGY
jgi:hypothetical protein